MSSYYEKMLATGEVKCIDEEIPFDVPQGWGWERWGNIAQTIQYGYNAPALEHGVIKMVRISDIQENCVLWEHIKAGRNSSFCFFFYHFCTFF